MAYSIGTDKLERVKPSNIKQKLLPEEEKKLTLDGNVLFDQLLPSPGSEERRHLFVQKLERLLNNEWPGHDIRVHMFGSSGNLLHSDDSDGELHACATNLHAH
jgi:DNA polymerase sigma